MKSLTFIVLPMDSKQRHRVCGRMKISVEQARRVAGAVITGSDRGIQVWQNWNTRGKEASAVVAAAL